MTKPSFKTMVPLPPLGWCCGQPDCNISTQRCYCRSGLKTLQPSPFITIGSHFHISMWWLVKLSFTCNFTPLCWLWAKTLTSCPLWSSFSLWFKWTRTCLSILGISLWICGCWTSPCSSIPSPMNWFSVATIAAQALLVFLINDVIVAAICWVKCSPSDGCYCPSFVEHLSSNVVLIKHDSVVYLKNLGLSNPGLINKTQQHSKGRPNRRLATTGHEYMKVMSVLHHLILIPWLSSYINWKWAYETAYRPCWKNPPCQTKAVDDEATDDTGINIVKCGMPKAVTTNKSVMVLEVPNTLRIKHVFISFVVIRRFLKLLNDMQTYNNCRKQYLKCM